jgi:hypothetical protein
MVTKGITITGITTMGIIIITAMEEVMEEPDWR